VLLPTGQVLELPIRSLPLPRIEIGIGTGIDSGISTETPQAQVQPQFAVASLLISHASFAVSATLESCLVELLGRLGVQGKEGEGDGEGEGEGGREVQVEVVIGLPTLGLGPAAAVARGLGLGTLWCDFYSVRTVSPFVYCTLWLIVVGVLLICKFNFAFAFKFQFQLHSELGF